MKRKLGWVLLVSLMIATPRALAGAQAQLSTDSGVAGADIGGAARTDHSASVSPPAEAAGAPDIHAAHDEQRRAPASGDARLEAAPTAGLLDAAYADSEAASAAVNRHKLTAFLAELDQTVNEFQASDGPPRDRGLYEALDAIRQMSDQEVNALHTALAPLLMSWAVADTAQVTPRPVREGTAPYTASETAALEDIRTRLLAYYDRFIPLTDTGASVDPNFAARLASLRAVAEDLTVEELAQMNEAMASVPTWETVLDSDPNALIGAGGSQAHGPTEAGAGPNAPVPDGATIQEHIHPGCKDSAFGPVVTAVLNYLANTAEDLSDIWSNDFFIAAFVGTNGPNIPKIVTMVIYYPLKIVAMAATLDQVLFINCNEFLHQTLLGVHDGEMLELTDLISGTLTYIDVDLNARFDRVSSFHTQYRESLIRLAIEEDLVRKGDKRISLFQLPESLCITTDEHEVCGMLETAHDVVEQTIETARNLGLNTDNAEASFVDGELQQAQGFYKEAYTRYREAYVLAVRAIP